MVTVGVPESQSVISRYATMPAEVAAPEVVAVEATPSGTVSDRCNPDLITFVDTDPEFIYGVGEDAKHVSDHLAGYLSASPSTDRETMS